MNKHLVENAERIMERVRVAAEKADRDPAEITVVAVSKTFDRSLVDDAYEFGFRVFGESRAQEIRDKFETPLPDDASIHLIGPLQTNKIRQVLPHINLLESLDRDRLANALDKELEKQDATLDVLLQANISGEEQKLGVAPNEAAAFLRHTLSKERLKPQGLMTMAPYGADEAIQRAVFGGLRQLRDDLEQEFGISLPALSMGMSDDFEIAIAEGSTHVRIGRALFGAR